MFRCIGVKLKQGEMFDDNKNKVVWDYCRCSVITDETPDTFGASAEIVKIKRDDFKRVTGLDYKDYRELVDHDIDARYTISEGKAVLVGFRISDKPSDNKPKS